MSKLTKLQLKEIGFNYLDDLNVSLNVLVKFDQTGIPSLFRNGIYPYPIETNSELYRRVQQIEKNGSKVFAITRDFVLEFGEMYSFLLVSPYEEDLTETFKAVGNDTYRIYAYVWNVNDDTCSEYGSVCIKAENGGLRRVG